MTGVNPLYFIVGMALLGLAPFFLMMVTSYVKIVVVTSLVRNALGVQQVPPAMVMNGLAIILSLFIMAPMMMSTMDIAGKLQISAEASSTSCRRRCASSFRTIRRTACSGPS